MTQLRSVTCHMGSHSVSCYPTQVNTPHLNPSHAGHVLDLPTPEGWMELRLSWPSWLDSSLAGSRTSNLSLTIPTLSHCTTKTTMPIKLHGIGFQLSMFPRSFILAGVQSAYSKVGLSVFCDNCIRYYYRFHSLLLLAVDTLSGKFKLEWSLKSHHTLWFASAIHSI